MNLKEKIEERKRGREEAKEFIINIAEWIVDEGCYFQECFWNALIDAFPNAIARPVPPPETTEPMSETQAKLFGSERMPYGQWKDVRIDDVPLDYLEWFCTRNEMQKNILRYVASKRIRREQGA